MLISIRNVKVYHRCLCYIFNQATMVEDQEFIWSLLWLFKTFILSVKLENIRIVTSLNSELENIRRIDIFVHVTCYPETMPTSRIVKKPCSSFKTKRSTELKTGQQIIVLKGLLPDKGKKLKFLLLVFSDVT